jgi:hypothetical protein
MRIPYSEAARTSVWATPSSQPTWPSYAVFSSPVASSHHLFLPTRPNPSSVYGSSSPTPTSRGEDVSSHFSRPANAQSEYLHPGLQIPNDGATNHGRPGDTQYSVSTAFDYNLAPSSLLHDKLPYANGPIDRTVRDMRGSSSRGHDDSASEGHLTFASASEPPRYGAGCSNPSYTLSSQSTQAEFAEHLPSSWRSSSNWSHPQHAAALRHSPDRPTSSSATVPPLQTRTQPSSPYGNDELASTHGRPRPPKNRAPTRRSGLHTRPYKPREVILIKPYDAPKAPASIARQDSSDSDIVYMGRNSPPAAGARRGVHHPAAEPSSVRAPLGEVSHSVAVASVAGGIGIDAQYSCCPPVTSEQLDAPFVLSAEDRAALQADDEALQAAAGPQFPPPLEPSGECAPDVARSPLDSPADVSTLPMNDAAGARSASAPLPGHGAAPNAYRSLFPEGPLPPLPVRRMDYAATHSWRTHPQAPSSYVFSTLTTVLPGETMAPPSAEGPVYAVPAGDAHTPPNSWYEHASATEGSPYMARSPTHAAEPPSTFYAAAGGQFPVPMRRWSAASAPIAGAPCTGVLAHHLDEYIPAGHLWHQPSQHHAVG